MARDGGSRPGLARSGRTVPVEVRARFDGSWSSGFELLEVVDTDRGVGFRVRRAGGEVLPDLFGPHDLRLEDVAAAAMLGGVPVTSDR